MIKYNDDKGFKALAFSQARYVDSQQLVFSKNTSVAVGENESKYFCNQRETKPMLNQMWMS